LTRVEVKRDLPLSPQLLQKIVFTSSDNYASILIALNCELYFSPINLNQRNKYLIGDW
jgi:hypothetical protein